MEWYVEGGRSRSGKLRRRGSGRWRRRRRTPTGAARPRTSPPGPGVDRLRPDPGRRRLRRRERRGAAKQKESFGWFIKLLRSLRRRFGDIHINFGEPLSLRAALGPADPKAEPNPDEQSLANKLAFEVAVRIDRVTPITPTSLVTLALLGVGDRALTLAEVCDVLGELVAYVRRRALPTTEALKLDTPDDVKRALGALVESGVVAYFDEGPETVYVIGPDKHLTAAYYRNTIIHFFVTAAIVSWCRGTRRSAIAR